MVDLVGQYNAIKPTIDKAVHQVLATATFINGQQVKSFAKNLSGYLDVEYVLPCANGTDAITVSLMALGLQPGDEVIVPDFTFIAPVEAVSFLGLTPVLADVDPLTYNIDTASIKQLITPRTKAIIAVHLFGQVCNLDELVAICRDHNLFLVEDVAQSLGATYTFASGTAVKAGTCGIIGCTSFFPSKNLGCFGDGGAIFTNDYSLADKVQCIINHGSRIKYYHDRVGINSRLDTIQAAILDIKLNYLDQYNNKRQLNASFYDRFFEGLSHFSVPGRLPSSSHVFHQYTITLADADNDDVQKFLASKGVPSMIYYPLPVHKQQAYQHVARDNDMFPHATRLAGKVLSLPVHTEMDEEQLDYVASTLLQYFS